MIFVVDPNNQVGCGKTVNEAFEDYDGAFGDSPIKDLKIFQGEEVELEFVLKPKVKKEKK